MTQSLVGRGTSKGMSVSEKSEWSRVSSVPSSMAWRQEAPADWTFPGVPRQTLESTHVTQIQEVVEEDEGHVLPAGSLLGRNERFLLVS